MAITGIANLVERLANQLFGLNQNVQNQTNANGGASAGGRALIEDTFTPSGQSNPLQAAAQDAGLFQLTQVALTATAAGTLLTQAASNANQDPAPTQPAPADPANTDAAPAGTTTNPNTTTNAVQQVAATPAAQAATAAAASTANVQAQLQALNAALAALGLSNDDIEQIDRIAALIQDFNPSAYTDLVYQFEALAQQAEQQNAANAANATANVAAGQAAGTGGNTGANANGGGFQVQAIVIKFTALQEAVNNDTGSGAGQGAQPNNIQIKAVNLQIEQAQFTLTNGNGQAIQVHAPQQGAAAGAQGQAAVV